VHHDPARFEAGDADQRQIEAARHLLGHDREDLLLGRAGGDERRDASQRGLLVRDHLQPLASGRRVVLGALTLGNVADVPDEGRFVGRVGPRHGQLDGELVSVGAHRGELDPPFEDVRVSGGGVPGQPPAMCGPQRRRHERFRQLPADDFIGAAPEDALGRGVDLGHAASLVDDDDAVEGRREDRAVTGLAGLELSRAGLRDLTLPEEILSTPPLTDVLESDHRAPVPWRLDRR